VGRFFQLQRTARVILDGDDMRVAEMIFYDRFLEDHERAAVTLGLAERYGITLNGDPAVREIVLPSEEDIDNQAVIARLRAHGGPNLNDEVVTLIWDVLDDIVEPLQFDTEGARAELHCLQDGTHVRLTLLMPLTSDTTDARLRVLFIKNSEEYLPDDAESGPIEGSEPTMVRLRTTTTLNAGEWIEVVTNREGAEGTVRIAPDGVKLIVERID
jgi:hypothetical protein